MYTLPKAFIIIFKRWNIYLNFTSLVVFIKICTNICTNNIFILLLYKYKIIISNQNFKQIKHEYTMKVKHFFYI